VTNSPVNPNAEQQTESGQGREPFNIQDGTGNYTQNVFPKLQSTKQEQPKTTMLSRVQAPLKKLESLDNTIPYVGSYLSKLARYATLPQQVTAETAARMYDLANSENPMEVLKETGTSALSDASEVISAKLLGKGLGAAKDKGKELVRKGTEKAKNKLTKDFNIDLKDIGSSLKQGDNKVNMFAKPRIQVPFNEKGGLIRKK
jgi:hypothetical protein